MPQLLLLLALLLRTTATDSSPELSPYLVCLSYWSELFDLMQSSHFFSLACQQQYNHACPLGIRLPAIQLQILQSDMCSVNFDCHDNFNLDTVMLYAEVQCVGVHAPWRVQVI